MARRLLLALGLLALFAAVSTAGGWFWLDHQFHGAGPLVEARVVIIAKGSGSARIARELEAAGILNDARLFSLGLRLFGEPKALRAGEFSFPARSSPASVAAIVQSGRTVVRRVTLAEGLTNHEFAEQLAASPGLAGAVGKLPQEGRLLPETYHYAFGDQRAAVLGRMRQQMDDLLAKLWLVRAEGLPLKSPEEALILASIVEKETGVATERARVAAVFINRLRLGMRLQSDPTVVYGLTLGRRALGRPLSRADLQSSTPYNTYVIKGLPLTAIANPGEAALRAVLHPVVSKELYFVADGSGGHAFAKTLKQHNANVAKWRRFQRQKRKISD